MATADFKVGKGFVAQNNSTFTTGSFSGQITSTVSTGTAPFVIASTTEVANLRAAVSTNLFGGGTGTVVYQSSANTSAFLTLGTQNYFLVAGASTPTYVQPTLSTTYFAATTSSQLAGVISDETGTDKVVFNTTPTFVTSVLTSSASFDVFNTTATTVNAFGAATTLAIGASSGTATIGNATVTLSNATTLNVNGASPTLASSSTGTLTLFNTNLLTVNAFGAATTATLLGSATTLTIGGASGAQTITIGGASTAASTYNFGTGTTANATTKTINIGTGGAAGSVTNINIGSASATANSSTTTLNTKLIVKGDLQVDGTTTTVNSTTITVDDPILVLGGDTVPTSDDNLDRGIQFRWHNGTSAKLGFLGFDDSTGYFTFIPDATDTSSVMSGTIGSTDIRLANALTFVTTAGDSATSWSNSATMNVGYSTVGAAASSHVHGNINNNGTIGAVTSAGYVITTTTGGALQAVNGTTSQWLRGDGTFTAVTLGNSQIIKFDTGTTEGTDLYTFNGSAAKTIDIKAGTNVTLTKAAGAITISATDTGFTNPMTTLGDIIYGGASGVATRLGANTSGTRKFLLSVSSAIPAWDTVTSTDIGLGNVENTALSTWSGSTNLVTVGAVTVDSGAKLDYNAVTVSANTATTIHSFAGATYRSAKFLVQLTQGTKYRVSEVTVLHDGTSAYAAEYGIVETGGTMAGVTLDAAYSAGTINLQVTVTDAATTNVASKALLTALVV